jgi:hypothetical protein
MNLSDISDRLVSLKNSETNQTYLLKLIFKFLYNQLTFLTAQIQKMSQTLYKRSAHNALNLNIISNCFLKVIKQSLTHIIIIITNISWALNYFSDRFKWVYTIVIQKSQKNCIKKSMYNDQLLFWTSLKN